MSDMENPTVTLTTELGEIVVDVHLDRAPIAAGHFLDLVDSGALTDIFIYRAATLGRDDRAPLLQGGPLGPMFTPAASHAIADNLPFFSEFEPTDVSGLRHVRGTMSFARDLFDTGAVIPEFFLCLGDYPDLDERGRSEPDERGFPAFATVTAGLDVADEIGLGATTGDSLVPHLDGEILDPLVRITATRRER